VLGVPSRLRLTRKSAVFVRVLPTFDLIFEEIDTRRKWKSPLEYDCLVVYYESRKRELKIRLMNEGRCDERLKARVEQSTCLTYMGCTTKQTRNTQR
jgi:hypothetical protein